MPTVQLGATLPEGKQGFLRGKFQYSLWSFDLKDFDLKRRSLSYCLFQMHRSTAHAYLACMLMRYLWGTIQPAYEVRWQDKYDKMFIKLFDWSKEELDTENNFKMMAGIYRYQQVTNPKLVEAIWSAYHHLRFLTDKSGFGNKLNKSYDMDDGNENALG